MLNIQKYFIKTLYNISDIVQRFFHKSISCIFDCSIDYFLLISIVTINLYMYIYKYRLKEKEKMTYRH